MAQQQPWRSTSRGDIPTRPHAGIKASNVTRHLGRTNKRIRSSNTSPINNSRIYLEFKHPQEAGV